MPSEGRELGSRRRGASGIPLRSRGGTETITTTPNTIRLLAAATLLLALPALAPAAKPRAVVVATDFETGGLATVGVATPRRVHRLRTDVFSDAVVRVTGGLTVVLNRFLADNVQVLTPKLRTRLQCGTVAGSNPHDIVVAQPGRRGVAPGKAYVTRYGAKELWIVDPAARGCRRFKRGTIDLSPWADADGLPEMDQMALVGDRLFVTVQRLDRGRGFAPTGSSRLLVIDTASDAVTGEIVLAGRNAFGDASGIVRDPTTGRLAVSTPGDLYAVGDGGIQWVDPGTMTADPAGFFVTEDQLGGNITDFVVLSATKAYAIVQRQDLRNALVVFDPTNPAAVRTLFTREAFLPDIALAPDGMLWLADQSRPGYGIRIVDPAIDDFVTAKPIDVGLPPFSIGFQP
jgi:hypothetical protein